MTKKKDLIRTTNGDIAFAQTLLDDLRAMIVVARERVAREIDTTLVVLYWNVGSRIRRDILNGKRAEYGERIVSTLSRKLGWSHFVEILPLEDELKRDFYAEMCRLERWSVRTLRERVASMLYERTALAKNPEKIISTIGVSGVS
jgi:hypothetical protein